jgi:hypothetical protein
VSKGILRFSSFHQLKELFSEIGDLGLVEIKMNGEVTG